MRGASPLSPPPRAVRIPAAARSRNLRRHGNLGQEERNSVSRQRGGRGGERGAGLRGAGREGKAAGRDSGSPIRAGAGGACAESNLEARPERAAQPERRPRYLSSAADGIGGCGPSRCQRCGRLRPGPSGVPGSPACFSSAFSAPKSRCAGIRAN